jgi:RNA-directed DNA polymerase
MRTAQILILRKILDKAVVPGYICSFEKGRSIPDMASRHVGKDVVISLDLADFFTSIKQHHLLELFEKLGFTGKAGRTLSELCTYGPFVPQGAITSPKISNLISAMTFGPVLEEYCRQKKAVLTIYADDITVSLHNATRQDVSEVIQTITRTVRAFGFAVNQDKTKVMWQSKRQYVCGAVVNEKLTVPKVERLRLRGIVHRVKMNGIEDSAKQAEKTPSEFQSWLTGKLNWYRQLDPVRAEPLIGELKMYRELYQNLAEAA